MPRFFPFLVLTVLAVMATFSCSENPSAKSGSEYEVLNPWADVDPIPVRGISPRVDTVAGKKIGLFANFKRAAVPIQNEIEKQLKQQFPKSEFILFHSTLPNVDESKTQNKEKFEAWAKSVDAVILAVAD